MLTKYLPNNQSLQTYNEGRFIEKTLADKNGQQFKVVFFVSLVNGELKGKLISAVRLETRYLRIEKSHNSILCLPCTSVHIQSPISNLQSPAPRVSPYFSLDYLITSQPTRAPSL